MNGGRSQVPFDAILIDTAGGFDSAKTIYTANASVFYYFHMSAGVPAYTRLNYAQRNGTTTPNILLTHTTFDGELVVSRDELQYLNKDQSIYMSSEYSLYSDSLLQTSWSGFRVDDIMSSLVLFRVARISSYYTVNTPIVFDQLLINVAHAWDAIRNHFVTLRNGTYFFHGAQHLFLIH